MSAEADAARATASACSPARSPSSPAPRAASAAPSRPRSPARAPSVAGCARHAVAGVIACDVGRPADVERFAAEVLRRFGPPDLLVNNAGIVARAPLDETSLENWDAVLDSNLKGTFLVTRAFLPAMRARRGGRIVNIASISGPAGDRGPHRLLRGQARRRRADARAGRGAARRRHRRQRRLPGLGRHRHAAGRGCPAPGPTMSPEDVANVVIYLAAYAPPALTGSCVDVFG